MISINYRDGRPIAERDLSLAPMQVAVSDFPQSTSRPREKRLTQEPSLS